MNKTHRSPIYLSIAMAFVASHAHSTVIMTDADFPQGHMWINPANPSNQGDLHIQNQNTVYVSATVGNTGVLNVENSGKLTADGHVHVTNTGTAGDAILVLGNSKAYFNGGFTAVTGSGNGYYAVAVTEANAELHTQGTSNIISPENEGRGLYMGDGTRSSFGGELSISAGTVGIYSQGQSTFDQKVNINVKGNTNSTSGIYGGSTTTGSMTFNDVVSINVAANSDFSGYTYGIQNYNNVINLNKGGVIDLSADNYAHGRVGVYVSQGQVNIKDNFAIYTAGDASVYSLYAANAGSINIQDSVVDITGRIYATGANSLIDLKSQSGSVIRGNTVMANSGIINFDLTETDWHLGSNSQLNKLNGSRSNVYFPSSDGSSFSTLKIDNLSGMSNVFWLNTVLNDGSTQETDQIIISQTSAGQHKLHINNVGGLGAQTVQGIKVVDVLALGSSSANNFSLDKPLTAGLYEYVLIQDGNDQSWYLTSQYKKDPDDEGSENLDRINPSTGAYLANQSAASSLFMHTLYDRQGHANSVAGGQDGNHSAWVRTASSKSRNQSVDNRIGVKTNTNLIHLGADVAQLQYREGNFHLGLMSAYGQTESDTTSQETATKITGKVTGYSVGMYGTWFANEAKGAGLYVDGWVQYGWYKNKVLGEAQVRNEEKYNSTNWTTSIEAGYGIPLFQVIKTDLILIPQIQITYNSYQADDHQDANLINIGGSDASGVLTRVGARLSGKAIEGHGARPYLEANWIHNTAKNELSFNGEVLKDQMPKDKGELKLGLQGTIAKNWKVWGQVGAQWGSENYERYEGQVSVNYQW